MSDKLTPKQQAFVEHYLVTLNASEAARLAGYSKRTADRQGHRLLKKAEIAAAIEDRKRERSERLEIDADWVLARLVEVAERCLQNVTPALGRDGKPLHDPDSGALLYRFDAAGANRALELTGKHISVGAFEERVSVQHGLVDRIIEARRRISPVEDTDYEVAASMPARALPSPTPAPTPAPASKPKPKPEPAPEPRRGNPKFRPNRHIATPTGRVIDSFDPFEPKGT